MKNNSTSCISSYKKLRKSDLEKNIPKKQKTKNLQPDKKIIKQIIDFACALEIINIKNTPHINLKN